MDLEDVKEQLRSLQENAKCNIDTDEIFKMDYEALDIALKELDKNEKMIDAMAECIFILRHWSITNENDIPILKQRIIEEFTRKVEEK